MVACRAPTVKYFISLPEKSAHVRSTSASTTRSIRGIRDRVPGSGPLGVARAVVVVNEDRVGAVDYMMRVVATVRSSIASAPVNCRRR